MKKFMTSKDALKQLWYDPKRVRFAIEGEDVSVMQVAEQFFIKGFKHSQKMAVQMANMLYDRAINGDVKMPPDFTSDMVAASTVVALRQLIESLDKELKKEGTVH